MKQIKTQRKLVAKLELPLMIMSQVKMTGVMIAMKRMRQMVLMVTQTLMILKI